MNRPALVTGARLRYDEVREEHLLLIPEGAVKLNETGLVYQPFTSGPRDAAAVTPGGEESFRTVTLLPTNEPP